MDFFNARVMAEEFSDSFCYLKDDIKTIYYPMEINKQLYIPKIEDFESPTVGLIKTEGILTFLEDILIGIEKLFLSIGEFFNSLANRAVFDSNIRLRELDKLAPIVLNNVSNPLCYEYVKSKQVNVVVGLQTDIKEFIEALKVVMADIDKNYTDSIKVLDKKISKFMSDSNYRTSEILPKESEFIKIKKIEKEYLDFIQKHIDPYSLEESNDFGKVFPNLRYLGDCIFTIQNVGRFVVVKKLNSYKSEIDKVYKRIMALVDMVKNNKIVVGKLALEELIGNTESVANLISYGSSIIFLFIQTVNSLIGASYFVKDFK